MRAVVQRVSSASVTVDSEIVSSVGRGLLILLAVAPHDTPKEAQWLAKKIAELRIFPDDDGKMNRSAVDVSGDFLVVSQFTLYGNCRKGTRPSFTRSAVPDVAIPLYERFVSFLEETGQKVGTGIFGADMKVELVNDGPVTLVIDTP